MIFQHTWQWLFEPSPHTGELKTLTSRIMKPRDIETNEFGNELNCAINGLYLPVLDAIRDRDTWRIKWQIGKIYAIQPARTQKAIGRFTIIEIKRYDVRDISEPEARAEGFARSVDFLMTWCRMHDKGVMLPIIPDYETGLIAWADMEGSLSIRPAYRYQAWQLRFEVNR